MNRNNVWSFFNAYIMIYYAQAGGELGHYPPDKRLKPLENVEDLTQSLYKPFIYISGF